VKNCDEIEGQSFSTLQGSYLIIYLCLPWNIQYEVGGLFVPQSSENRTWKFWE